LIPKRQENPRAFVLHLRAEPGVDGIRSFRALLKVAVRRYGLRAIEGRELDARAFVFPSHPPRSTRETTMSAFSERIRSQKTDVFKVADFAGGREATLTIDHLEEKVEMFDGEVDVLTLPPALNQRHRRLQRTRRRAGSRRIDRDRERRGGLPTLSDRRMGQVGSRSCRRSR
jgi:hypothetical protein